MKEFTQSDLILNHLKEHNGITSWEAIKEYGCTRLSARIHELRKRGIEIINKNTYSRNRYGQNIRYVRYCLKEKEKISFWDRIRTFL